MESKPFKILMTGAASGFGQTMRHNLVRDGHTVVSIGIDGTDDYSGFDFRVLRWDDYYEIIHDVFECHGGFDCLINNAGSIDLNFFKDQTHSQINDSLAVNLIAPLALMQAFLDLSLASKPVRIINTVSMAIKTPPRACVGYVAAKAGLEAATRAVAREYALVSNITTILCCIAPCAVENTTMQRQGLEHLVGDRGMTRQQAEAYQQNNPIGRMATHDEIYQIYKFAIESMPHAMTGTTLYVPAGTGV